MQVGKCSFIGLRPAYEMHNYESISLEFPRFLLTFLRYFCAKFPRGTQTLAIFSGRKYRKGIFGQKLTLNSYPYCGLLLLLYMVKLAVCTKQNSNENKGGSIRP